MRSSHQFWSFLKLFFSSFFGFDELTGTFPNMERYLNRKTKIKAYENEGKWSETFFYLKQFEFFEYDIIIKQRSFAYAKLLILTSNNWRCWIISSPDLEETIWNSQIASPWMMQKKIYITTDINHSQLWHRIYLLRWRMKPQKAKQQELLGFN